MNQFKYYFHRLFSMSYKQMLEVVNEVHKRSEKNRIVIFFDMIYCSMKYLAGYMDYLVFNFEDLNAYQRSTFITRGVNNAYIKAMNNPAYYEKFDNKILFNQIFEKYIQRDYLNLEKVTISEFSEFVKKHPTFIAKPINLQCGKGIEKIDSKELNIEDLYHQLKQNGQILIEEAVEQSKEMNALFPTAVNTLRIVTARKEEKTTVLFRALRIGNGNNVVDNFNHGGMYTVVNEKGIIEKPAIDKKGNIYEVHPITKTPIAGFQIPHFDQVVKMVEEASSMIPEVGLVGWDIAVTDKGPVMIEGNQLPGYDIYQSKVHLNKDKIGLKPTFDQIIYSKKK